MRTLGFLISAKALMKADRNIKTCWPCTVADDLIGELDSRPTRFVTDFHPGDILEACKYANVFVR